MESNLSSESVITWLHFVTAGTAVIIGYLVWTYTFFIRNGIPGPLSMPLVTTIKRSREASYRCDEKWIRKYGKVVGFISAFGPTLLISDLKILRQILGPDFKNFHNRPIGGISQSKRLHSMLITLRDEKWKNMRSVISPAFTSSKIRKMGAILNECAEELLLKMVKQNVKENQPVEIRQLFGTYTIGCIASAGFGLQLNAQPDEGVTIDEFIKNATEFFSRMKSKKWLLFETFGTFIPRFVKLYFDLNLVPQASENFLYQMSEALLKKREEGKVQGHIVDFMQLLINAHELEDDDVSTGERSLSPGPGSKKTKLAMDDVVSQCVMFLLAGYETTLACLVFTTYLLAIHPDIQDKVCAEIQEVLHEAKATRVTLDLANKMPYLGMVINESLRLYPPVTRLVRICNRDTNVQGLHIKQGTRIIAPLWAIQRDPDLWPDPLTFNPDRFSPESQGSTNMDAFLSFGVGPRACLGTRFALMEVKIALVRLLAEFKIEVTKETPATLELSKGLFLATSHPLPLKFVQRA
ncbi:cytochrome P450 3A13-like [Asterias rubens]|uniref:cytochrome P450 3A13-like n=1 Tax=Asterias rubens TaxID=7604 RepID=UPI001455065C|nr:cytochrome P450 3A13-like [Asterias rubens]